MSDDLFLDENNSNEFDYFNKLNESGIDIEDKDKNDIFCGNFEDQENFLENNIKNEIRKAYNGDKSFYYYDNNEILNDNDNNSFFLNDSGERDELFDLFKGNDPFFFGAEQQKDINNYNKQLNENWNLFDKEKSQINYNPGINNKPLKRKKKINENRNKSIIEGKNKGVSNLDNHDIKLMNQTFSKYIPLEENIDTMNKKSLFLNKTEIKFFLSNNNESSLQYKSKFDSFINYSNIINIKDQSISSLNSIISLGLNMTAPFTPFSFYKNGDSSFNSTFSQKKRKRNENKINNSSPNIRNKKKLFHKYKGRKKKDNGEIGKHDKYARDNLRAKVKTLSTNFLLNYFNNEIKNIKINDLNKGFVLELKKLKAVDNKTKVYFLELLNKPLSSILSAPNLEKFPIKEDNNKNLIEYIYNKEGNLEKNEKLIKLFNMKYEDFFNYIKIIKDNNNFKEKNSGLDDDIKAMINKFDVYCEKELRENDEDYKQKVIEEIKNFPNDIKNMQVKKKKE